MMLYDLKIKEIMTTGVKTVRPRDYMQVVSDIFATNNFHHIPVVEEDGRLVGIITVHDYNIMLTTMSIFKTDWAELDNKRFKRSLLVQDVMTKSAVKLGPDDPISKAASIFRENLFHAIPIVDEDNIVIGILSTYDLLNYAFNETKMIKV